jgi:spermidine synthase
MKKSEILSQSYEFYCSLEGNKHIASEYAICKLQELIDKFEVKSILEVGLGIGAIAGSLLKVNKDLAYTGTENNEFCLKALKKNLGKDDERLNLLSGIKDLDYKANFDLILIDGKDAGLEHLSKHLSSKGIIAIEGDRLEQQRKLQNIFPNHFYVHCISKDKNKEYSPFPSNHWQGGIKVIFVNPDFKQKLWWVREKLKTKLKYIYRGF